MIVHITLGKLKLNKSNGVVNVVHNLADYQSKSSIVEVWGISDKNFIYHNRSYLLRIFKRSLFHFFSLKLILNLFKNKNVLVYHLHGGWNFELIFISFFLRILNKKYVVTPHGAFNPNLIAEKKNHQILFYKTFVHLYLKNSLKVHLFSENERNFLKTQFLNLKYCIVPNGIEMNKKNKTYSKTKLSTKTIFGYCGRLQNKDKAVDKLIHGFNHLLKNNKAQAELWLIGDGPDKNSLVRKVKELGIEKKVIFFGALYGKDKNKLLKKIDAFTLVSNYEGMPISALEALSFGKFLIVTEATNLREYINKYNVGFSLKSNTSEEICNALKEYINENKINPNFSNDNFNNALRLIDKEFKWDIIAKKMINEYK